MQKKTIVILTKSSKYGKLCVAGIDVENGSWIRLCCTTDTKAGELDRKYLITTDGKECDILEEVEIYVKDGLASLFQPENVYIDETKRFKFLKRVNLNDVLKLHPLENTPFILGNANYKLNYDEVAIIKKSLSIVKVSNLNLSINEKNKTKAEFHYNNHCYRYVSVTDPNFFSKEVNIGSAVIVVSLPDDDWSKENGYFKYIAKIFIL